MNVNRGQHQWISDAYLLFFLQPVWIEEYQLQATSV